MKTRVKTNVITVMMGLLLLVALTVTVKAGNTEDVRVVMLSGKKVMLKVQNPSMQQIKINITDQTNQNLYSASLPEKEAFLKVYDLSKLPEGDYKLTLELNNKVLEKDVRIKGNESSIISEATQYLPYFSKKDNDLLVSYLNTGSNKVSVSFSNNANQFFTDTPEKQVSIQRSYSLKNLEPGQYTVELSSGDKLYSYAFEVQ